MDTNKNNITLHAHIDTTEIDSVIAKAERLKSLLEEANSLADELASKEIKLSVDVLDRPAPETLISQEVFGAVRDLHHHGLPLIVDVGHLA